MHFFTLLIFIHFAQHIADLCTVLSNNDFIQIPDSVDRSYERITTSEPGLCDFIVSEDIDNPLNTIRSTVSSFINVTKEQYCTCYICNTRGSKLGCVVAVDIDALDRIYCAGGLGKLINKIFDQKTHK